MWTMGGNSQGRLGLNDRTNRSSPTQIPGTTWRSVGGSDQQVFATKTDGTLWGWGTGTTGQLGLNSALSRSSPTQIPGTWENTIEAGGYVSAALKN